MDDGPQENVNLAADNARSGDLAHMRGLLLQEMRSSSPFLAQLVEIKMQFINVCEERGI